MKDPLIGKLMYEAKVKPAIKLLVDRVAELTDEEIDQAKVPLPWFRIALRKLRDQYKGDIAHAQMYGIVMDNLIESKNNDAGTCYLYDGEPIFVKSSNLDMEVTTGTYLFTDGNKIWVHSTVCRMDKRLLDKFIGDMTYSQYYEYYQAKLSGGSTSGIWNEEKPTNAETSSGFKFKIER
jgi:hypothetical protein